MRMSRLVDDLLVYARLGAPAREQVPVELGDLVVDAVDEFQAVAASRRIELIPELAPSCVVDGDALALRQGVANLLHNAVRLAPESSRIWLATGTEGDAAWVTVTDEGPGIAEEDRAKVFQRFWRGDQKAARAEGRSGLGLAIVAQIMADHGGNATVAAAPTGGSIFTLWLPRSGTSAVIDPAAVLAAGAAAGPVAGDSQEPAS
jgi:signal transduction histidine kinase